MKTYKDLYSFDSKRVECLSMIKDMVVVMDIVVADIPARFGMIFSRSWGMKLGGSIKLYLTYATIPILAREEHRLYKESRFVRIVTKA